MPDNTKFNNNPGIATLRLEQDTRTSENETLDCMPQFE
jgi:hypothetical protein